MRSSWIAFLTRGIVERLDGRVGELLLLMDGMMKRV